MDGLALLVDNEDARVGARPEAGQHVADGREEVGGVGDETAGDEHVVCWDVNQSKFNQSFATCYED